jgi:hypothetical protein
MRTNVVLTGASQPPGLTESERRGVILEAKVAGAAQREVRALRDNAGNYGYTQPRNDATG